MGFKSSTSTTSSRRNNKLDCSQKLEAGTISCHVCRWERKAYTVLYQCSWISLYLYSQTKEGAVIHSSQNWSFNIVARSKSSLGLFVTFKNLKTVTLAFSFEQTKNHRKCIKFRNRLFWINARELAIQFTEVLVWNAPCFIESKLLQKPLISSSAHQ